MAKKGKAPEPLDLPGIVGEIVGRGLEGLPLADQLFAFCSRVAAAGFPMKRVSMGVRTLHPQFGALTFVWRPGMDRVEFVPQERAVFGQESYTRSPIYHLSTATDQAFRQRLDTDQALAFPVLEDLRDAGMTDYAARLVRYDPVAQGDRTLQGVFFSCATDDPEGFNSDHLAQVSALLPHLAIAIKSRLTFEVARTVTETYLGRDAGQRVLTGEITRGSVRSIRAVIWFCDLRGFSRLAGQMDRDALISLLNAHLESLAQPVVAHGGQILKFLGDGFLATFELSDRDSERICGTALDAAAALRAGFSAFKRAREESGMPALGFGLALHVGEVSYGNIGTDDRLDFTVVGPAVNEASRIQDLCRPLNRDVLVSAAFRTAVGSSGGALRSVGSHALRGLSSSQELFTLADG